MRDRHHGPLLEHDVDRCAAERRNHFQPVRPVAGQYGHAGLRRRLPRRNFLHAGDRSIQNSGFAQYARPTGYGVHDPLFPRPLLEHGRRRGGRRAFRLGRQLRQSGGRRQLLARTGRLAHPLQPRLDPLPVELRRKLFHRSRLPQHESRRRRGERPAGHPLHPCRHSGPLLLGGLFAQRSESPFPKRPSRCNPSPTAAKRRAIRSEKTSRPRCASAISRGCNLSRDSASRRPPSHGRDTKYTTAACISWRERAETTTVRREKPT